MYALSYDTSGLFLPHSNTLETLQLQGTSYVTSFSASFWSLIVNSNFYSSVEHSLSTSAEYFCDKVSLTMIFYYLSSFAEQLCDKVLCTMMRFDLSLSVKKRLRKDQSFMYNLRNRAS